MCFSGALFANSEGKPLCLNNLTNRIIQPRLEFCKRCAVRRRDHDDDDHDFVPDPVRVWHGWHAFRRGLGTNLYRLGVSDKVIQSILRHSNLSTTMNVYVKSVDADAVTGMKKLERLLSSVQPARYPSSKGELLSVSRRL